VATESGDPSSILMHYRALLLARSQHAALRVGALSVVTASSRALYSILRVSKQEAVLVLVNLTGKSVTDYRLDLEESDLGEGVYTPLVILGEGTLAPVSASSRGGFSRYVPVAEIPPYATFIIQLQLNSPGA
jgi:hypothetical protein